MANYLCTHDFLPNFQFTATEKRRKKNIYNYIILQNMYTENNNIVLTGKVYLVCFRFSWRKFSGETRKAFFPTLVQLHK